MDNWETSYSLQITELDAWATQFASLLRPGMRIGFVGSLGAGKTTLIRHLVKALGSADPVSSPTYVLAHEYHGQSGLIEHWDLYRLQETPEQLLDSDANCIRLIEWADKFLDVQRCLDCCCYMTPSPDEPLSRREVRLTWLRGNNPKNSSGNL